MEQQKQFNQYLKYYEGRPTDELQEIAFQEEMYLEEARMAAMLELRRRGEEVSEEAFKKLEATIEKNKQAQEAQNRIKVAQQNSVNELPEYYSPAAILGFSIFFSVIFGGALMYVNLRKAGKKSEAVTVIIVSSCIMLVSAYLVHMYQMNQWIGLLANVSGAVILIEYFWKKHLGYQTKFKRKPLAKAILISIGISFALFVVLYYLFPEQFPQV